MACRLYKSLAKEAAEDYLEVEICEELRNHAECVFFSFSGSCVICCFKKEFNFT